MPSTTGRDPTNPADASGARRWVILDVDAGVRRSEFRLHDEPGAGAIPRSVDALSRVLQGGLSDGVQVVEVRAGDLSFTVVPTRGMGIWRGMSRGIRLGWDSPVRGPVHPSFVALEASGGRGWLAGFDEWVTRCGVAWNGVPGVDAWTDGSGVEHVEPITLHGRIANLPARRLVVELGAGPSPIIRILGEVVESSLFGPQLAMKTTYEADPRTGVLRIHDEVVNLGAAPTEVELLYHINFGAPILEGGGRIVVPLEELAPFTTVSLDGVDRFEDCTSPRPGTPEEVFLCVPVAAPDGWSLAMLEAAGGTRAAVVRYDTRTLPRFVVWKLLGAMADGYVVGLEPSTNYPNLRTFERRLGRVPMIAPDERREFDVTIEVLHGVDAVGAVRREIADLQTTEVRRHRRVGEPFTPGAVEA